MDFSKKWISFGLAALTAFGVSVRLSAPAAKPALAETQAKVENAAVTDDVLRTRLHGPDPLWLLPAEEAARDAVLPADAGTTGTDLTALPDFIPPVIRLRDPVDFSRGEDAPAHRFAGKDVEKRVRDDAERYLKLCGGSLSAMTASDADPADEAFRDALPAGAYAAAEKGKLDGFTLYIKPENGVFVTVSGAGISLRFSAGSALADAVGAAEAGDADPGALALADPYFYALTLFCGVDDPVFTAEGTAADGTVSLICHEAGETAAERAVSYYTDGIRFSVGGSGTEPLLTAVPNDAGSAGTRAEICRTYGVSEARAYADGICARAEGDPDALLETTLVWRYERTGLYRVPAYRFCYGKSGADGTDGARAVVYVTLPAADLYLYLTTPPTLRGDADNNGKITAADARLILRAAVSLEAADWPAVYDMNADGRISAADARDSLRVAVGLPIGEEEKRLYEIEMSSRREAASRRAEEESRKAAEESRRAEEESRKAAEESRRAEEERLKREAEQRRADFLAIYDKVSYDELDADLRWLVNSVGVRSWWNDTQNDAADLIYNKLLDYGFDRSECSKMDFVKGGITGRNVMAKIPTKVGDPDILLILSHYDTARGTGGAVDNASGATTLLQLAKRFREAGTDFGIEVRFLFTAGEEQGYYGAYAYVNGLSASEKGRHIVAFNMDMTGKPNNGYDPGRSYYLCVSTEPVSTDGYRPGQADANAGSDALDAAKETLGDLGEDGYYSPVRAGVHDLVPFRKAGMKGLTLSWRVKNSSHSSGADYSLAAPSITHLASDNVSNFDMDSLYNTTRLAAGAVARLILPYTDL